MECDVIQRILRGSLQVVSYPTNESPGEMIQGEPPLSVDESEGLSAQGLAVLYSAKCLLAKDTNTLQPQMFLEDLVAKPTLEEIMSVCDIWPPNCRFTIDNVLNLPLFAHPRPLLHNETVYGEPGFTEFRDLLSSQLGSLNTPAALVIARAPEIVACTKIVVSDKSFFILFDALPRKSHPEGAGLIISQSVLPIAHHLNVLLNGATTHWQVHHYNAHVFVSNTQGAVLPALRNSVVESSRAILKLQAEISHLKSQALAGRRMPVIENAELDRLMREAEVLRADIDRLESRNHSLASRVTHLDEVDAELDQVRTEVTALRTENAGLESRNRALASEQARLELEASGQRLFIRETPTLRSRIRHLETERSAMIAARAAEETRFKREVLALRCALLEMAHSFSHGASQPASFDCSICLESHPETEGVRIEPCNHMVCTQALKHFIGVELQARRFPIHCPTCAGQPTRSVITEAIARQVSITEEEHAIWYELELRPFAVLVECRGPTCQRSFYLDKDDFAAVEFITCPLPQCHHRWCKICSVAMKNARTAHSCDGKTEFDALRKQKHWQLCPGCQSTVEKINGCDAMRCTVCQTRFNYRSGRVL